MVRDCVRSSEEAPGVQRWNVRVELDVVPASTAVPATKFSYSDDVWVKVPETGLPLKVPVMYPPVCAPFQSMVPMVYVATMTTCWSGETR